MNDYLNLWGPPALILTAYMLLTLAASIFTKSN